VKKDAHQGNGHERDAVGDDNVFIIDVFNDNIYPGDRYAKTAIREEVHVEYADQDGEYIDKVRNSLRNGLTRFRPDFIIYNAGTDCMRGDPLGSNCITLIRFKYFFSRNYPKR
jgi:histone deacetylase 11